MRPGYGMFQQQSTTMRLTHQLRKAIMMLKLSTPELLAVVQHEVTENPVLEMPSNAWDAYNFKPQRVISRGDHSYDPIQSAPSNEVTLERHLMEQLDFMRKISPTIRRAVSFMIGNLDTHGYLRSTLPEICEICKMEMRQAEHALTILQSFEPRGVGARNLKECLLIQVQLLSDSFPLVATLIRSHLKDVADYKIHKLSTVLQVGAHEIQAAIDVIRGLNPRPGAAFHIENVHYIIPEVLIEKGDEGLDVYFYQAASSRPVINSDYERMVVDGDNHEISKFLTGRLQAAKFFLKCLEQRQRTISRVVHAIVEEQADFFWMGTAHLKPMTLKQIADKLGVHESTVSRATAGKYAQTPWGMFELKYFFPSGLLVDMGHSASSERVKARIREWISGENHQKPFSDQKLAELLNHEGIHISRRTITKYREELGISSSVRRKRI